MSLQKKQLLKLDQTQDSSSAKKTYTSLASDCIGKAPIVLLYDLKSELRHQNKKQNIKQRDHGRHSHQSSQERLPDDGSVHNKSSQSLPLHSERLASNTDITYHHQQQDTTENRGCTSLPIESLKIPVAPPFLSNVQPETQGKESANIYDRAQHQSQKLQKTDQQEGQSVNNFYTSLAEVCKWKQPVIKLLRTETQLDHKGKKRTSKLDSEQHSVQKLQKTNQQEGQSRRKQPIAKKLLCLETKKKLLDYQERKRSSNLDSEQNSGQKQLRTDQQEGLSGNTSYASLEELCKWKQPVVQVHHLETQLDYKKIKRSTTLQSEQFSHQCTDITRKHEQQKCGLETVCLKQPVVQLTRLNIEAKSQIERQTTKKGVIAHHQDHVHQTDSTPINLQPENWEEQVEDDSDEQCTDITRKHDQQKCGLLTVCLKQPVVQLTRLNIKAKSQVERQTTKEDVSAHHQDYVPDNTPLNVQLENREEQVEDDSDNDQSEEQCTDFARIHDLQKCGLETVCSMKPVVQLTRLNIKNHVERQPESQEEQVEDDSDSDQYDEQISAYERERLRNLKANAKFLKSLKLLENVSTLWRRQKKKRVIREKPPCNMANRESRRLRGCSPLEKTTQMLPITDMDNDSWISFKDTWKSISAHKFEKTTSFKCRDLTSYAGSLSKLRQDKTTGICTVPGVVTAIAVHPSSTHSLVAAGDIYGTVVLWDRNLHTPGKYRFPLHSGQTSVVTFSPSNSQHLLSLGQEGTIFRGDICHSAFTQIYHVEQKLASFDFLSDSGSVLLVGHSNSRLSVVDCRTNTYDVCSCVRVSRLQSVSVHPLKKDLFVVSGCGNVLLYDVRMLRIDISCKAQPLMGFRKDRDFVPVSATFSPGTGKYILTPCRDRCIRVFTIEDFTQNTYPLNFEQNIHHLNSLYGNQKMNLKSYLPVTWDPKQENCFAEGLMNSGQINVFHVKGQSVGSFFSSTCTPNALAIHPTRNLVAVGTCNKTLCVVEE
ncbi:WD repeat-containing protein 76 [Hyla sarda]|uniref:WD repeat-containing protein 76 n=1 Tax=Hyla sarda TaxID=327740 RepID=UPI0024C3E8CF|nr:WD repeat-containing protein 76 [Hyla sarda]